MDNARGYKNVPDRDFRIGSVHGNHRNGFPSDSALDKGGVSLERFNLYRFIREQIECLIGIPANKQGTRNRVERHCLVIVHSDVAIRASWSLPRLTESFGAYTTRS